MNFVWGRVHSGHAQVWACTTRGAKQHRAASAVYRCGRVVARAAPRRRRCPRRDRDGPARQHL